MSRNVLEILVPGDPALRKPCSPVILPDPELPSQLEALRDTLADFRGRRDFGRLVRRDSVSTIADGIAVRIPIPEALEDMRDRLDDLILLDDDPIVAAMQLLFEVEGIVAEPAGAAGVAAMLSCPDEVAGAHVATVICGSNLTGDQARRWLSNSAERLGGRHDR